MDRPKQGGRVKGTPNKVTASVKQALTEAFERKGGVPSLLKWAEDEPTAFYQLWGRLAPAEVHATHTGALEVVVRVAKEGRRVTRS